MFICARNAKAQSGRCAEEKTVSYKPKIEGLQLCTYGAGLGNIKTMLQQKDKVVWKFLGFHLAAEVYDALKREALADSRPLASLVRKILENYVKSTRQKSIASWKRSWNSNPPGSDKPLRSEMAELRAENILAKTLLKVWLTKWESAHFKDKDWKETDDFLSGKERPSVAR